MKHVPRLLISGKTDVGRVREHNEDAIAWDADVGLVVLADGMGGHNAGEVASTLAVETIEQGLRRALGTRDLSGEQNEALIASAIEDANRAIRARAAAEPECSGMGTTVLVARFCRDHVVLAHVGDSRAYLLREERLQPLTVDHSLIEELVAGGYLSREEAQHSLSKNVITRALGTEEELESEVQRQTLKAGDLFLLCSDGLTDLAGDEEIRTLLLTERADLQRATAALVGLANERGGTDNISVILVEVLALAQPARRRRVRKRTTKHA